MPETAYAKCGDLCLAYQVFGDGPVDLVFAGSFASHVELYWTMPDFKAFMERLATFSRVILFDKAGVGLSDPVPQVRTLDERAAEIEAVMDAAGFGTATLLGVSEGGPAAMLFAASRPDRTRALILTGAAAYVPAQGWEDLDRDPAELRARSIRDVGEDYTPSIEQIIGFQHFGRAVLSAWGSGEALKCLLPSVRSVRQLGMLERMCASPGMARATLEAAFQIDARPVLPAISAPTLVIHATRDPGVPVQAGHYLADHIRGARMVELEGTDHAPWFTDPERVVTEIEELLTGSRANPAQLNRALRTVLFTDIVASTERAAATGDERWRAILQRFGEITAEAAERCGGTVVKSTGDGHLMTFEGPTHAIRCAEMLRDDAESLGIEIRVGIHTGECELMDADIGGIAVHIAARTSGRRVRAKYWCRAPSAIWLSAPASVSRSAESSSCAASRAAGSWWPSTGTALAPARAKQLSRPRQRPGLPPPCAGRTELWRSWRSGHRGLFAGWRAWFRSPSGTKPRAPRTRADSQGPILLTGRMHIGVLTFVTDDGIGPVELGAALEQRGFESLFLAEHSHIPVDAKTPYPGGGPIPPKYYRTLDPFVALTAAAVATEKLILGTGIALVVQRDPIHTAKGVASLDLVSQGRFRFGVGVGWLREEIANHGVDPSVRGRVVDERLDAMIEIWTKEKAEFHGKFVDFDPIYSWPKPVQKPYPPLYLGGGPASFKRIARLNAGWLAMTPSAEVLAGQLEQLQAAADHDVPVINFHGGEPTAEELEAYRELELDHLLVDLPTEPRDETLRRLDALQAEIVKLA